MKIKTIAIIQIIIGVLVAIFPIYYLYTNYFSVEESTYGVYLEDMVKNLDNNEQVQEEKNLSFTEDGRFTRFYILGSTLHTSRFFYNKVSEIFIFENIIIFLVGIGFIFNGLYRLEKK